MDVRRAGFIGSLLVDALISFLCVAGQSGLKGGKFRSLDGHVFLVGDFGECES